MWVDMSKFLKWTFLLSRVWASTDNEITKFKNICQRFPSSNGCSVQKNQDTAVKEFCSYSIVDSYQPYRTGLSYLYFNYNLDLRIHGNKV